MYSPLHVKRQAGAKSASPIQSVPRATAGIPLGQPNPLWSTEALDRILTGQPLPETLAEQICELAPLASITRIETVNLSGTRISTLDGIRHLKGVRRINLSRTMIVSLEGLCDMQSLEEIDISFTKTADLSPLVRAPSLRKVVADYTPVAQIGDLLQCASLREIHLRRTKVNVAALEVPRRDLLVFID